MKEIKNNHCVYELKVLCLSYIVEKLNPLSPLQGNSSWWVSHGLLNIKSVPHALIVNVN